MAELELVEVAQRRKGQPPPPRIVWEALDDPASAPDAGSWRAQLRDDEQLPVVLASDEPRQVVWSSLWPDLPDLRIRFDLEPGGGGTMLRWTLLAPEGLLGDGEVRVLRHRINYLINDVSGLRGLFEY